MGQLLTYSDKSGTYQFDTAKANTPQEWTLNIKNRGYFAGAVCFDDESQDNKLISQSFDPQITNATLLTHLQALELAAYYHALGYAEQLVSKPAASILKAMCQREQRFQQAIAHIPNKTIATPIEIEQFFLNDEY